MIVRTVPGSRRMQCLRCDHWSRRHQWWWQCRLELAVHERAAHPFDTP